MGAYAKEHYRELTVEYLELLGKECRGELLTEEERKRYDYLFLLGMSNYSIRTKGA